MVTVQHLTDLVVDKVNKLVNKLLDVINTSEPPTSDTQTASFNSGLFRGLLCTTMSSNPNPITRSSRSNQKWSQRIQILGTNLNINECNWPNHCTAFGDLAQKQLFW